MSEIKPIIKNKNAITIHLEDKIAVIEHGYFPQGRIEIKDTKVVDVNQYAEAQVVDENLVSENILKGKTILGIEGQIELPSGKIEITTIGKYDVEKFVEADVNIPIYAGEFVEVD